MLMANLTPELAEQIAQEADKNRLRFPFRPSRSDFDLKAQARQYSNWAIHEAINCILALVENDTVWPQIKAATDRAITTRVALLNRLKLGNYTRLAVEIGIYLDRLLTEDNIKEIAGHRKTRVQKIADFLSNQGSENPA